MCVTLLTVAAGADTSDRQLIGSTLANGVARGLNALVAIALTPFLISRLGLDGYGVWVLATTLTFAAGYASLAELGLQQASVRVIAAARSTGDTRTIDEVVSTTFAVFVGLGLALAVVFAALSGALVHVFGMAAQLQSTARTVFLLAGTQIAFDLPTAAFTSVIEGAQRFSLARSVEVPIRLGWGTAVVLAVLNGAGVEALAWCSLGFSVVSLLATASVAFRVQRGLSLRWRNVSRRSLRTMGRESSGMLGARVLSVIYNQMDRLILGVLAGVIAVSEYDIVFKIHAVGILVVGVVSSAVMPAAASLSAVGEAQRLRAFFIRGSRLAMALSVPVIIAAMVFAERLIDSWVGGRYTYLAGDARLFLLYPLVTVLIAVGAAMLTGVGRVGTVVRFESMSVGINLALSLALTPSLGVRGVVIGTVVGAAASVLPLLRSCLRAFETPVGIWVRMVLVPNLPGAVVTLGLSWALIRLTQLGSSFVVVGIETGSAAVLGVVAFVVMGASGEDRDVLRKQFRRVARDRTSAA